MTHCDLPSLDTLLAKYPLIYRAFKRVGRYQQHPFAYRGFECGDGWHVPIAELSEWLENEARLLKTAGRRMPLVVQVKEKFGGLGFYVQHFPRNRYFCDLLPRIALAETKSKSICEVCGHPGLLRREGYYKTLCEQHADERKRRSQ